MRRRLKIAEPAETAETLRRRLTIAETETACRRAMRRAGADAAAQLGCQMLWIMFLAYAAVWWLFNGLRPRLHSVSKLLKSDFTQAFLFLSCCCAAWTSRAGDNVPISLYVFVLSRSGVVLCWCAVFVLLCFYT